MKGLAIAAGIGAGAGAVTSSLIYLGVTKVFEWRTRVADYMARRREAHERTQA